MSLGNVVVTGTAGRIGSVLRNEASQLVLIDREELTSTSPIEEVHQLDLRDLESVVSVCKGADAFVHLSGIPDEASFPDLLDSNVLMTYHVLEAARRQNVRKVVLASSNRGTGFYARATAWVSYAPLWLPRMCTSRRCTRSPPTPGGTGTQVRRGCRMCPRMTPRHTPPR